MATEPKKTRAKKVTAVAVMPQETRHVQEAQPVQQEQSVEGLITLAIKQKLPVETMERFFNLRKEVKAEAAREAYIAAMAKFQAECPTIVKTKVVNTNTGKEAYRYAPIESVVAQVKTPLMENGFSYSTNMEMGESSVKVFVKVQHIMGHSETTEMEVPLGTKTAVMSQSQVVAAASTFAKRYAFLNAFGILTGDEDNDAKKVEEGSAPQAPAPVQNIFERARQMIERATDPDVLNDYLSKIMGSDKYTVEEKERIEGIIAARVEELEKGGAEKTIEA